MNSQIELIMIFSSVIFGVIAAAYFYTSAGIFMDLLKRPIRLIASGMLVISIGVLVAAWISFEQTQGYDMILYGIPVAAYFYVLYIVGSILILLGARKFTHRPEKIASAV